ncbi:MAG: nitrous oxide-stimulated promoter family protein [Ignavibacteriota bacterium]
MASSIKLKSKRLERERITIGKMIDYYCSKNHSTYPCADCTELKDYALKRLLLCPFDEDKPVCSNCTVHCYKTEMRQRVKDVMRYSGPRMLMKHPYLAVMHLIDERIYKPLSLRRKTA